MCREKQWGIFQQIANKSTCERIYLYIWGFTLTCFLQKESIIALTLWFHADHDSKYLIYFLELFNLLELVFNACVAAVKCRPYYTIV